MVSIQAIQKSKKVPWAIAITVLAILLILTLGGCGGDALTGKTLYSVSPTDGTVSSITFNEDGKWHGVSEGSEATGEWSREDETVVLTTSNGWVTFSLTPAEDGSWQLVDGKKWECFYSSEEKAKDATEEFISAAPDTVRGLLEGTEWRRVTLEAYKNNAETLSFSSDEATYKKGVYEEGQRAPDQDEWLINDHSGRFSVTVEHIEAERDANIYEYKGTLTIGETSVPFELRIFKDALDGLTLGAYKEPFEQMK